MEITARLEKFIKKFFAIIDNVLIATFHSFCVNFEKVLKVVPFLLIINPVVDRKGLAKLGNIVAETLLLMQMFPSLAARETCVAETNFAARKQKMFLPGVKNIFASRTQILRLKHMFPQQCFVV